MSQAKKNNYFTKDNLSAIEARYEAQKLAFGPVAFQAARCLRQFHLLDIVSNQGKDGITLEGIQELATISAYGVRVLMEAALGMGLCTCNDGVYHITKTGIFVMSDPMTIANFDFNHDVNYQGLFYLDEAIETGKPSGLKTLGNWETIYEGLSSLPEHARESWLAFDHYYSDGTFQLAFEHAFASPPKKLLDIGGNTGKWARTCIENDDEVTVTIADLPQQIALATDALKPHPSASRVSFYPVNVLHENASFPTGYDTIWMSQFLDCFSDAEITDILSKVSNAANRDTRIFILETFWDKQRYEAAAFSLQQTSLYFTCMANGNSQMYHSDVFKRCIDAANLEVIEETHNLGRGHTLLECRIK